MLCYRMRTSLSLSLSLSRLSFFLSPQIYFHRTKSLSRLFAHALSLLQQFSPSKRSAGKNISPSIPFCCCRSKIAKAKEAKEAKEACAFLKGARLNPHQAAKILGPLFLDHEKPQIHSRYTRTLSLSHTHTHKHTHTHTHFLILKYTQERIHTWKYTRTLSHPNSFARVRSVGVVKGLCRRQFQCSSFSTFFRLSFVSILL